MLPSQPRRKLNPVLLDARRGGRSATHHMGCLCPWPYLQTRPHRDSLRTLCPHNLDILGEKLQHGIEGDGKIVSVNIVNHTDQLGTEASVTCGNKVVDQCVVVLGTQQGAGEHHTVEWHVVLGHKVVQLHLVVKKQQRRVRMTSY